MFDSAHPWRGRLGQSALASSCRPDAAACGRASFQIADIPAGRGGWVSDADELSEWRGGRDLCARQTCISEDGIDPLACIAPSLWCPVCAIAVVRVGSSFKQHCDNR